jgi:hypothetical protein
VRADSWAQIDPQRVSHFANHPIVLFQQGMRRVDQCFADVQRVVFPEVMKAKLVQDASFLSYRTELASVILTLELAESSADALQAVPLLASSLVAYSRLINVAAGDTNSHTGGRILLAACDKLFDSSIDSAGFGILRDVMQLEPPYSVVFANYSEVLQKVQLEKIRAIGALFHAAETEERPFVSPIDIGNTLSKIRTTYFSSLIRVASFPVLCFLLQQAISSFSSALPPIVDPALYGTVRAATSVVAEYSRISRLLEISTTALAEQEQFVATKSADWRQLQLLRDSIVSSLEDGSLLADIAPLVAEKTKMVACLREACSKMAECASEISMCEQAYFSCETEALRAVHSAKSSATKSFQEGVVSRRQAQRALAEKGSSILSLATAIISYEDGRSVPTWGLPIATVFSSYVATKEEALLRASRLSELGALVDDLSAQQETLKRNLLAVEASQKSLDAGKSVNTRLQVSDAMVENSTKMARCTELVQSTCLELDSVLSPICRITDHWMSPGVPHIHSCAKKIHSAMQRIKDPSASLLRVLGWIKSLRPGHTISIHDIDHIAENMLPTVRSIRENKTIAQMLDEAGKLRALLQECVNLASEWLHGSDIEDEEADDASADDSLDQEIEDSRHLPTLATRNQTAITLLRRVKQKLEGSDAYGLHFKQSVIDQVDRIIKEAISIDNLSRMYEGWTAWI